jgi:hypothetical protein
MSVKAQLVTDDDHHDDEGGANWNRQCSCLLIESLVTEGVLCCVLINLR